MLVEIKGFIMQVDTLDSLQDDQLGVSETQRKFLNVSKIEDIQIKLSTIKEHNSISELECEIECGWLGNPSLLDEKGNLRVD